MFRRATHALQEADSSQDWIALFTLTDLTLTARYSTRIAQLLQRTYVNASNDASKDYALRLSFDLKNPRAVQYGKDRATELLRELNTTTKEEIKQLIVSMLDTGESYQSVARKITARFKEYSKRPPMGTHIRNRAELVAITEAAHAYQSANYSAVKDMLGTGLTFRKAWITVGDSRVSQGCQNNAGENYIDLENTFSSGHQHPPRFSGCRCSVVFEREK